MGAGKTELVGFLCKKYGLQPFFEPHEGNPYLEDFYKDMKGYGLRSQLYFLTAKLKLHRQLEAAPGAIIQDRTIYEDAEIFARTLHQQGSMSDVDYENYVALFNCMVGFLRSPDLIVYLKASPETLMGRIAKRGRESEKAIGIDYIQRLNDAYDDWMRRAALTSEVLTIDTDAVPMQGDTPAFRDLIARLKERYPRQAELRLDSGRD